jgi:fermentation-respiration switch protein FrsA (DUF1100 family)
MKQIFNSGLETRLQKVGLVMLLAMVSALTLVACGDNTATPAPATTPAPTSAPVTTAAQTTNVPTTAAQTTAPATTVAQTTAAPSATTQATTAAPATTSAAAQTTAVTKVENTTAPEWYKQVPNYDKLQTIELDDATLAPLGIKRSQFYVVSGTSSEDPQTVINFYGKGLIDNGWLALQRVPLLKEENGQQVTFIRTDAAPAPTLILLVANKDGLAVSPATKTLTDKLQSGQSLVMLFAQNPVKPASTQGQTPVLPPTTGLPEGVAAQNLTFSLDEGWTAQGQITYPAGKTGPFPTVILVHGSGGNDMDETLPEAVAGVPGGSKPLQQIAYYLPTRGFAVIRYNKRGVVGLGPQPQAGDLEQLKKTALVSYYLKDAEGVLKQSLTNSLVDPQRVIMLGHSEGTLVISNLVKDKAMADKLAGVVLMGVMGQDIKTSTHFQIADRSVNEAKGVDANKDGKLSTDEYLKAAIGGQTYLGNIIDVLTGDKNDWTKTKFVAEADKDGDGLLDIDGELKPWLDAKFATFPQINSIGFSNTASYLGDAQSFGSVTSALTGSSFRKPVLMLNGEADIQTPVGPVREADAALEKAGFSDHKLITYPGLGHTFYPVKGFQQPLGPIQDNVLKDLGDWLSQRYAK